MGAACADVKPPTRLTRCAALRCGPVVICATAAMNRSQAEVEFRAVVIDVGCEYVRYSKLGALCDREPVNKGEWGIYEVARNPWPQERHASSPRMFVPAKVRKARGHYWSALSSFR
jgi:hypothetical protein